MWTVMRQIRREILWRAREGACNYGESETVENRQVELGEQAKTPTNVLDSHFSRFRKNGFIARDL